MISTIRVPDRFRQRMALGIAVACLMIAAASPPLQAELIVFSDGRVMHVRAAVATGPDMTLALDNGGELKVSLERVEHVVKDEVDHRPRQDWLPSRSVSLRFERRSTPRPTTPYADLIEATAREYDLNPDVMAAMMKTESDFQAAAVSSVGAIGLMQVMPATGLRFGVRAERLDEPGPNLIAAARYLRWLADHFDNDLPRVLAAYNAGERVVERYGGVPPYRETHDYILRIYRVLDRWADSRSSSASGL